QPQTLRNADHAKAARYHRGHHRILSQRNTFRLCCHLFEYQPYKCQPTGGKCYEAHEIEHISKNGSPHGLAPSAPIGGNQNSQNASSHDDSRYELCRWLLLAEQVEWMDSQKASMPQTEK